MAKHSVAVGQVTVNSEVLWMFTGLLQVPDAGSVEVTTLPWKSTATQRLAEGQDTLGR